MKLPEETRLLLRRWAQWELGDPTWGDEAALVIEEPDEARRRLDFEGADHVD